MESFQSGVAEMSITIMHNIGNILAGLVGQIHKVKKGGESINRVTTLLMQLLEKFDEVPVDKQRKVIAKSVELIDDKLRGDIVKPARHLEKGVNSISEIIRLQKSNIKPIFQLTNFQPRTLINDVVIMLEPQHKVNRIAISIDITDEIHELYLPRNQLFQVLVNIVKNSIEAIAESKLKNGEGKIVIQLTKSKVDKVAGYLFTVEDNGIGIDSAQLKDLFQFGKSSKKDGSGVGLHSSGNFANSFGGKMWVDSDGVERGASSNVWLPLQQRIKV
jgi:signal transduction histidine kinase